ncbi:MAG: DsbA family protein [Burkholderiaceae bacterium]
MTPKDIDLFFSFRSPYSYLATPDALALEHDFAVHVRVRPVLPLAVRDPSFFSPANAKRARYIRLDAPRRAQLLGRPFAWPRPDPIVQNMQTMEIAADQPHIRRLTRLGVEAARRGRGVPFAAEVSRLIFGGTEGWNEGAHLADAAARAGLSLAEMDAAIADPGAHDAEIAANQDALDASGQWGVPTFVVDGEPFFGQDRVDSLRWRLDQLGLAVKP